MTAAKRAGVGHLIDSLIEDGKAFYILQVKEISDRGVKADAIVIERTLPGEFIQAELKHFKIPLASGFYSVYRIGDLSKPGMIFAKSEQPGGSGKDGGNANQ